MKLTLSLCYHYVCFSIDRMTQFRFQWGHDGRYNDFSSYFRKKFNGRVQKISVDAGFTCPNRDGVKSVSGCSYCNNRSFNPGYCRSHRSIRDQIKEGIGFFSKKYPAMQFLAYFQAYSNTYAKIDVIKDRYEEALSQPGIIGLVIGTRPDCISGEILDYLEELSRSYYIMVEFGVESVNDGTLKQINRGHTFWDSVKAFEETSRRNILNCAHLILGLPGEGPEDLLEQARAISRLPVNNLKLHQLQIHKGTRMAVEYASDPGKFNLFSVEGYLELLVGYLELLNPEIVVERFVSQAPSDMVIAPNWGLKNFEFTAMLQKKLELKNTWQGRLFK